VPGDLCPGPLSCPTQISIYDCHGNVVGDVTCTCGAAGDTWQCIDPPPPCDAGGPETGVFDAGGWGGD
jgi:hypothetical protein